MGAGRLPIVRFALGKPVIDDHEHLHGLRPRLSFYFRYYHRSRTHLSLGKQCPTAREVLTFGEIVAVPQLGGLHHRYERIAA